jgi:hypothetical protein
MSENERSPWDPRFWQPRSQRHALGLASIVVVVIIVIAFAAWLRGEGFTRSEAKWTAGLLCIVLGSLAHWLFHDPSK